MAGLIMDAILYFQMPISQSFEELKGSNMEVKQMTLKFITRNNFDINLSRISFTGLPMAAFLDF